MINVTESSKNPEEAQTAALPADLDVDLLASWLNYELGLHYGVVTQAHLGMWYEGKSEKQRRQVRASVAWWIERHQAQ